MKPPSLEVIDFAIDLIRNKQERYSCLALASALRALEYSNQAPITPDQFRWQYYDERARYQAQYRQFSSQFGFPAWWSASGPKRYTEERIAALQDFKRACIEAAQAT